MRLPRAIAAGYMEPDEERTSQDLASSAKKTSGYSDRDARKLLDDMPLRGPVAYNVMIRDYIRDGNIEEARNVFDRMPERSTVSWNSMIMGYSSRREMHAALKLFLVMPDHCKDAVSWTAAAGGLARARRLGDSLTLLRQSPRPHPAAWASVVAGAQHNGLPCEALLIFREMLSLGVSPASHSFTSAAAAAADLPALFVGRQLFSQILRRGFGANTRVGNSVISMFMKSGSPDEARSHFDDMPGRDLVSWNALITGFGCHGLAAEAISKFHQMQLAGLQPDSISFIGVLLGCSHSGLVHEGQRYFDTMQRDFGIRPQPGHYACLIDAFARAGMIREAAGVILGMPFEASSVAWRALLNGCRIYGEHDVGLSVAARISELERGDHAAAASLMAMEICRAPGRGAEEARFGQWTGRRVGKEVGCSWVEVEGRAHVFTTRDETHHASQCIYMVLMWLTNEIAGHQ